MSDQAPDEPAPPKALPLPIVESTPVDTEGLGQVHVWPLTMGKIAKLISLCKGASKSELGMTAILSTTTFSDAADSPPLEPGDWERLKTADVEKLSQIVAKVNDIALGESDHLTTIGRDVEATAGKWTEAFAGSTLLAQ